MRQALRFPKIERAVRLAFIFPLTAVLGAAVPPASFEGDVLDAINFARTNPTAYAAQLRTYRSWFDGKVVRFPGNPVGLLTEEGVPAVDEAIAFLERQQPLPPLLQSDLLAAAAGDHVREQGPAGTVGHGSADGSGPGARVAKRGGGSYIAETIGYGSATGEDTTRQLIVDDGVASRGHRRIIFSAEYRYAGTACGSHRVYRTMCVTDFGRTADGR